ncbi:hypothetical protein OG339_47590 (plasmid) [Streptosporangium sp. NBC_01495]|uniref:hypothetical protein n=1 Tax=Streptosporangium sp. NBC_01495 TaxID=2903899 RepID=UPI002E3823FD|nr:hypothetical protein [Streptosporangium sp. NBC_01495]
MFEWPDWCWLPMGAAATIVQQRGMRDLADAARLAAVGQWKLHSRSIVIPSAEVVRSAEPGIPGYFHDVDTMEMAIPRDRLLSELGAACHYLVTPFSMPVEHTGSWLYGSYIHLEYDKDAGRTELRLLLDFGTGCTRCSPTPTSRACCGRPTTSSRQSRTTSRICLEPLNRSPRQCARTRGWPGRWLGPSSMSTLS